MTDTAALNIKDGTANPAPLGLFGFGMTTVLLNVHNAGLIPMSSMILAMGICYGGIAQVIAGVMEWKKNNTFGTTAFTSYGFFWLSLVVLLLLPKIDPKWAPDDASMASYLALWGLFTFGLFIGTFRLSAALIVVFGSLTILFFLLAYGHYASASFGGPATTKPEGVSDAFKTFTGYEGIFCGLSAMYTGIAQVLNEVYGKMVLPLGVCTKKK